MLTSFIWMFTGGLAGLGHVFSGPDHLAAVAPLATSQKRGAWRSGLFWGLGHSGGVWLLAGLALLAREALPIDTLSTWSERLVGFVLIGVGLWGLRRTALARVHSHEHQHDGLRHTHMHVHEPGTELAKPEHHRTPHAHTHGALAIGTLHGLAGTSHLVGVLPSLLIPSRIDAALYVLAYGLGSILAMTLFSWIMGLFAGRLEANTRAYRGLQVCCGFAAIAIGCFWIVQGFTGDAHA